MPVSKSFAKILAFESQKVSPCKLICVFFLIIQSLSHLFYIAKSLLVIPLANLA